MSFLEFKLDLHCCSESGDCSFKVHVLLTKVFSADLCHEIYCRICRPSKAFSFCVPHLEEALQFSIVCQNRVGFVTFVILIYGARSTTL